MREILIAQAASRWRVAADQLRAENSMIMRADGQSLAYGDLVSDTNLHVEATPQSRLKRGSFKVMGQPMRRVDIPAKVTGAPVYVQDMRLPGMVHARGAPAASRRDPRRARCLSRRDDAGRRGGRAQRQLWPWWPSANSRRSRPCACWRAWRSGREV